MLKKYNRTKLLELFFDNPLPEGGFQLREISRTINLAPKSVMQYLDQLIKQDLIIKKTIHNYPVYYANRDNNYYKFLKKLNTVRRLEESGLLNHISNQCTPETIILFGSASRGEDTIESDIDLYIKSQGKSFSLTKYEKQLNRKINLFFEDNFEKLSQELKNNIVNGIKLRGYLRLWKT